MISSYSSTRPQPILEALNLSGQGVVYQNQLMPLPTNSRLAVYGDSVATRYLCSQWVQTSLTKGISPFRLTAPPTDKTYLTDCRPMDADSQPHPLERKSGSCWVPKGSGRLPELESRHSRYISCYDGNNRRGHFGGCSSRWRRPSPGVSHGYPWPYI